MGIMLKYGWNDLFALLRGRKLCLPAFDVAGGQAEFLRAVLGACEAARCPAAVLAYAGALSPGDLEACVDLVAFHERRSSVPVVLHLDHAQQEAAVERALAAGFRSVMFDGSALPLEENIRRTRTVAAMAHERGAAVEGELGRIGAEGGEGLGTHALTDPEEAALFAAETRVDLLAPAVGNAHGFYKAPPRLRLDLIEQIADRTGVALSLHGGTGLPYEQVRRAAELGVRKMNVATCLHKAFADALRSACAAPAGEGGGGFSWRKALGAGKEAIAHIVAEHLRELGVEGLA